MALWRNVQSAPVLDGRLPRDDELARRERLDQAHPTAMGRTAAFLRRRLLPQIPLRQGDHSETAEAVTGVDSSGSLYSCSLSLALTIGCHAAGDATTLLEFSIAADEPESRMQIGFVYVRSSSSEWRFRNGGRQVLPFREGE